MSFDPNWKCPFCGAVEDQNCRHDCVLEFGKSSSAGPRPMDIRDGVVRLKNVMDQTIDRLNKAMDKRDLGEEESAILNTVEDVRLFLMGLLDADDAFDAREERIFRELHPEPEPQKPGEIMINGKNIRITKLDEYGNPTGEPVTEFSSDMTFHSEFTDYDQYEEIVIYDGSGKEIARGRA